MRDLKQWVTWRSEERDGKATKIPYSPRTGSRASSMDPATWAMFSEAVAAHRTAGDSSEHSGIGFVFTAYDAYCGVDLDNCRDSESGELEPWAREIADELDSYTEVSPSGTGLHIICRGELPPGRNRKGSVEAYQSGRYFTVTGRHLEGTPQTVEERTQELQAVARRVFGEPENGNGHVRTEQHRGSGSSLEDEKLIRRASEANDGGKFRELFSGGYSGHTSHSEAAAALLLKLAFWSGKNASQMERIFRRSGLMYEKFDSRRGGTTWGAQEIEKAIEKAGEVYTPPGARLTFGAGVGVRLGSAYGADVGGHDSSETGNPGEHAEEQDAGKSLEEEIGQLLSEVEPEEVSWLWTGRIPLGKLSLIDGDPGTGKSGLTGDLAARVSVGADMPDGSPCGVSPSGVVLLSAEDGLADTIRPRLDAAGADPSKVLALATTLDSEGYERMLSIPEDLALIERGIRRVGARLAVVDPLMAFLSGEANAHKDQDTRKALAPLAALAERTGAAVLVVRHLNKASGGNALYRGGGSIGIIGAARSALLVAKDPEDESRRVLAPMKSNLAEPAASLVFTLEAAEKGAVRVAWQGDTDLDATKLLSTPAGREEGDAFSEAMEFLRAMLASGPVPARQVQDEAEDASITEATLRRAKKALSVAVYREGVEGKQGGGKWVWEIPALKPEPQDGQEGLGAQTVRDEHLNLNEGSEEDESPIDTPDPLDAQGSEGLGAQGGDEHLNRHDEHLKKSASTVPEFEWGEI